MKRNDIKRKRLYQLLNTAKLFYVGSTLYQRIEKPSDTQGTTVELKPISRDFVKQIIGGNVNDLPFFHDFINKPAHLDYEQEVVFGDYYYYNTYAPFPHEAQQGDCKHTLEYVKHIFGEQYDMGLDYLKLLLEKPTQKLPILCLVSKERSTGKSTFLNWLKSLFGLNMTINRSADFESNFNSDWIGKLIIAIDETLVEKQATSEMLKNISTAFHLKQEGKGTNRTETEFFGKLILCSNNIDSFVRIDKEEIRYWVRHIKRFEGTEQTDLLTNLVREIPHFIYFLTQRNYSKPNSTRMYFSPEDIWTEALEQLKEGSKSTIEKELEEIIITTIADFQLEHICFTEKDLIEKLREANIKANKNQVSKIITEKWGLTPRSTPSTYKAYHFEMSQSTNDFYAASTLKQGRFFTFSKNLFKEKVQKEAKKEDFEEKSLQVNDSQLDTGIFDKKEVFEVPF